MAGLHFVNIVSHMDRECIIPGSGLHKRPCPCLPVKQISLSSLGRYIYQCRCRTDFLSDQNVAIWAIKLLKNVVLYGTWLIGVDIVSELSEKFLDLDARISKFFTILMQYWPCQSLTRLSLPGAGVMSATTWISDDDMMLQ
jgi:hypothetical protein